MFRSFYLAGFECATGWNMHREWIDQIAATGHDLHLDADYERLAEVGIRAVREPIRWPMVDKGGRYDFSSVEPFVTAALRHGFDVIWDLFHYGYPEDLDPFGDVFVDRFADYCRAAARYIAQFSEGPHYFTPVNEPSFLAWAGAEVGLFAPHARDRGFELKVALARAAIQGITAIREELPGARIVNVDPICRVVPPGDDPQSVEHARRFNDEWVFEFWDMVSGRMRPEMGGSAGHLDIVGINYYWTNQWQLGAEGVPLADDDPRRVPLSELVRSAWRRYRAPLLITETSGLGDARAPWITELATMAEELQAESVPLGGICLYPILGMPEWHAQDQWTRMGLWDIESEGQGLERKPCSVGLDALATAHQATRLHGLVREQAYVLDRTGDSPFQFLGHLVWQRAHPSGLCLRLFRSNRPYRLWIAAIVLPTPSGPVEHVSVAARLSMLLEDLTWLTPMRICGLHGIAAIDQDPCALDRWREDMHELAGQATHFQALPLPLEREHEPPIYPIPGGGRK